MLSSPIESMPKSRPAIATAGHHVDDVQRQQVYSQSRVPAPKDPETGPRSTLERLCSTLALFSTAQELISYFPGNVRLVFLSGYFLREGR